MWFFVGLCINWLVGNVIMVLIDDENESIFEWYKSADEELGFLGPIIQFISIQFWPIILVFWLKNKLN